MIIIYCFWWRIALNNSMGYSSAFTGNTSVEIVKGENVKQFIKIFVKLNQPRPNNERANAARHDTWKKKKKVHTAGFCVRLAVILEVPLSYLFRTKKIVFRWSSSWIRLKPTGISINPRCQVFTLISATRPLGVSFEKADVSALRRLSDVGTDLAIIHLPG